MLIERWPDLLIELVSSKKSSSQSLERSFFSFLLFLRNILSHVNGYSRDDDDSLDDGLKIHIDADIV